MTGEVTSVSPDKGRLHVKTAESDLTLRDNGPAPDTK